MMPAPLLRDGPVTINVGLRDFADALAAQAAPVVHVDWSPARTIDPTLARLLDRLG